MAQIDAAAWRQSFGSGCAALLITLALAACGQANDEAPSGEGAAEIDSPDPVPTIPETMHGAWGMTAADCAGDAVAADGRIEVSARSIRFYESTAQLQQISQAGAGSLRATFVFTGEGETWPREMRLDLRENGETLVRSDFGENAIVEPMQYRRCSN